MVLIPRKRFKTVNFGEKHISLRREKGHKPGGQYGPGFIPSVVAVLRYCSLLDSKTYVNPLKGVGGLP